MTRTIINSPFLAFYSYDKPNKTLAVCLKTGQQILVDNFDMTAYNHLKKEKNKGQFMFHNILKNPNYHKRNGDNISREMVEQIIVGSTNQKPRVYRWLAS